jgi:hypothetical protein
VETDQVKSRRRRGAASASLALLVALAACGSAPPPPVAKPVVLPTRCERGPYCVTGEVDDQFSIAVEGAKCIALLESGSRTVLSDAHGVFYMDGLAALPRQVRFEKAGFNTQSVAVLPVAAGSAAPVYVIFHRIADSECSCEPAAIMAGHDACPDDKCGRSRFDLTIPETPKTPPATPAP